MLQNHRETEYQISIEQIAAGLAHEVKNPLSLVRANIDLLEVSETNDDNRRQYVMMKQELNKINDLMLDFISLTKPQRIMSMTPMHGLAKETVDSYIKTFKDISFTFRAGARAEENPCFVRGDATKLSRAMHNLIKNAAEAVQSPGGSIDIFIDRDEEYITVEITDNGPGMPEEKISRLDEPYFTTKSGGSGLGLYLSVQTAREHDGELTVRNMNPGCRVSLKIPVYEQKA